MGWVCRNLLFTPTVEWLCRKTFFNPPSQNRLYCWKEISLDDLVKAYVYARYNDTYGRSRREFNESIDHGDDEVDDLAYGQALQQDFGDRIKTIPVHEKAGIISAPHVRNTLADGDYESFAEAVPEAAYNKGAAPKIFKMLATKVKGNGPEQA